MGGFGSLRSVVLEHLGFDAQREPIGATDYFGGPLDSASVNGRKLALNTALKLVGLAGTLAPANSFADGQTGSSAATVALLLYDPTAANYSRARGVGSFRGTSVANTALATVVDLLGLSQVLDISMVASGGTATLVVEVSVDNVNWIQVDSIAAALSTIKHYNNSTVGATTAITPLAFRYVRVTAGAAGVGNTTTLTVSAK